jgi:3-hydroxybutyryl-CoA dehydratase
VNWDFRAPTRAGDTLRAEIEVAAKRETKNPEHGLLELSIHLVNQSGTIVQTGLARLLMRRARPENAMWGLATT